MFAGIGENRSGFSLRCVEFSIYDIFHGSIGKWDIIINSLDSQNLLNLRKSYNKEFISYIFFYFFFQSVKIMCDSF